MTRNSRMIIVWLVIGTLACGGGERVQSADDLPEDNLPEELLAQVSCRVDPCYRWLCEEGEGVACALILHDYPGSMTEDCDPDQVALREVAENGCEVGDEISCSWLDGSYDDDFTGLEFLIESDDYDMRCMTFGLE